jgi:SanA protein
MTADPGHTRVQAKSDATGPARGPTNGRRGRGRVAAALLATFLALVLSTVIVNVVIVTGGQDRVASPSDAPPGPVAIVLGARVYSDGTPSPVLADRLDTGIELYRSGKVPKLLLTGDSDREEHDEVEAMRTYVLERGVASEDIFLDRAGFSTFDSLYRARDVFLISEALVVTQDFHLPRAVYIARRLGLEAVGVSADRRPYAGMGFLRVREWAARCKALLQLHVLDSRPEVLGPAIPISGKGNSGR